MVERKCIDMFDGRWGHCMVIITSYMTGYGSTAGKVANPGRGQLKRENKYSAVPVRA